MLQLCRDNLYNYFFVNILIFIHALRPIGILVTDMQMQHVLARCMLRDLVVVVILKESVLNI